MSNPMRAKKRLVISHYDAEGDRIDYQVTREEGQAEVAALLERLEKRRRETDEQLMSMDDALRELEVPEADRCACGKEISAFVNKLEKRMGDYVDYTQTRFARRYFIELCETIPGNYSNSYLERRVIIGELEANYHDFAGLERIVDRLADVVSGSREKFDHFEVTLLLRKFARAFEGAREAAKQTEPS